LEATESTLELDATESTTELDATESIESMSESMAIMNQIAPKAVGGRPKGSTSAHSHDLMDRMKLMMEEAAAEYMIKRCIGKQYRSKAK
jgi:hypothetical protein